MSSPDPKADNSTQKTGNRDSDDFSLAPANKQGQEKSWVQSVNLRWSAGIQGVGIAMALLPPHWYTAGIIIAGFGTLIFSTLASIGWVFELETSSHQRDRSRTTGRLAILYAVAAILASITATLVPPHSIGPGITFAVMAFVPLVLGTRLVTAANGVALFRAIGRRWTLPVATVVAGLFLILHLVAAIWSGNNSWISVTSLVLLIVLLPAALMNAGNLRGPKWAGRVYLISMFALIALTIPGGQSAWLTVSGASPQSCRYVATDHDSSRTSTSEFYYFRCGGELLRYDPNFVGTAELTNGQLKLVTDRTGLTNPLRPQEVPGVLGSIYLGTFLAHAGSLAVLAVYGFRKKTE